jgi:hypothetical protein
MTEIEYKNEKEQWWSRAVSVGTLLVSITALLVGVFTSLYFSGLESERRWAVNDKVIAILQDRQNFVIQKNVEQDDRMNRWYAEQHVYMERILIQLEANGQRLSTIEREQQRDQRRKP